MSIALETLSQSAHRALRDSYRSFLLGAILFATTLHVLAWWLTPPLAPRPVPVSPRVDIRVIQMARDFHILPPPAAIARPQFDTSGEIVPVDRPIPELQTRETEIPPFAPSVPFDDGGEAPDLFAPTQSRAPEVLHMEPPQYPQLARAAGCEGFVVVRVTIDTEGRVAEATVVRSDVVKALEDAALEAARRWIFSPARQGGRAVAVQLEIPFSFTLD